MTKRIIFTLILSILIPATTLAWNDCPHNEVNCPAPGDCTRYVDVDNDEICDRSQPAPENGTIAQAANTPEVNDKNLTTAKQNKMTYHLIPISLFLIILYAITHILSKKKIISVVKHRKIWNVLLLITFLFSGISGVLLVIKINFGIAIPLLPNILFLHVETGIAMFMISVFHTFWHWTYFKNLFRARK